MMTVSIMLFLYFFSNCFILLIEAEVSLAQSQYSTVENSNLSVDIKLNGSISEDVMVKVMISDGSAKGNRRQ